MGPEGGQGFNIRRPIAAVWRYKWLVLLCLLAGSGAGMVAIRFIEPTYTTQATVWIEVPTARSNAGGGGNVTVGMPLQSGALLGSQSWLELLRSFQVLDHVVMEQRLFVRLAVPADSLLFSNFAVTEDFRPGAYRLGVIVDESGASYVLETQSGELLERGPVGDSIGRTRGLRWQPPASALWPGRSVAFQLDRPRDVSTRLSTDLKVRTDQAGNFLRIELSGRDPRQITATVNAVTERFVALSTELKVEKVAQLEGILAQQLAQAGEYLRDAEIALESFRVNTITLPSEIATPAPGLESTQQTVVSRYFDTKFKLDELRQDRLAVERVLAQVQDGSEVPILALEMITSAKSSSELTQVLNQLSDLRVQVRTARQRYTDAAPAVDTLLRRVEILERHTVPAMLQDVIRQIAQRESELDVVAEAASAELREIPPRVSEEARLVRHVSTSDATYTQLRTNFEQARLAAETAIPDLRILDRAAEPTRAVEDRRRQLLLMFIMGSLAVGMVAAIGLDFVDPRLRYPEQVTELGLATLGAVPHVKNGRRATLPPESSDDIVEAFRGIRLNLTHAYGTAGPMLLTITSPGPGDGKSFVSLNLALAFARSGYKTLLIDGDVRRGALHERLMLPRKPGLTNYLRGEIGWDSVVRQTSHPALSLISAGARHKNAPELLGLPPMGELLSQAVRARYSVVLVDSAPLAAGVDPLMFATWTRSLIMVLRTGNTNRELAGLKLELVNRLPIRMLGAVLNDVPPNGPYRYYGYYSGYEIDEEATELGGRALHSGNGERSPA